MGIYIKGMKKKPKDCKACFLGLYDRQAYCRNGEQSLCPLIEVKEPHGRLIDIDKIMDANTNWELGITKVPTFEELVLAPIVIEAEESE